MGESVKDSWEVSRDSLEQDLARIRGELRRSKARGEGASLQLSLRETVALALAIEEALNAPDREKRLEHAYALLRRVDEARFIAERGDEKRTESRLAKAAHHLDWGREKTIPLRNATILLDYQSLIDPPFGWNSIRLVDVERTALDHPPESCTRLVEGLPLQPAKALKVISEWSGLSLWRCWDILRLAKAERVQAKPDGRWGRLRLPRKPEKK